MPAKQPLLKIIEAAASERARLSEKIGSRNKMDLGPVNEATAAILDQVKNEGDTAVCRLTETYDHVLLRPDQMKVSEHEISQALASLDPRLLETIRQAAKQIRGFHEAQRQQDVNVPTAGGGYTKIIHRPLDLVGVYVPGGTAPLPSSVLMNVLPARAAGVRKVIMCTPPDKHGQVHPAILAAASIADADEIYKIGGAQAIAAMAYGTVSIPRVDKITGPGNIYVNTAKRLVYGQVDIDMFAGPSEILIIADETANPEYIAADLLSQAEHDVLASAILITPSRSLADQVAQAVERRTEKLSRAEIIRASLTQYGAALVVPDLKTAVDFANELAPEHLELMVADPDELLTDIVNAGAVFIGDYSPEPLGDYWAGPNHVLPTSGTARFFSPLNTSDFIKKMSLIRYEEKDLAGAWQQIARFADAESLPAHADAVRVRFGQDVAGRLDPE